MTDSTSRRADLTTEELERARKMDEAGVPRTEIAKALGYKNPSNITRKLGSKRKYTRSSPEPVETN